MQLEFDFGDYDPGVKPYDPNRMPTLLEVAQGVLIAGHISCDDCKNALRRAVVRELHEGIHNN